MSAFLVWYFVTYSSNGVVMYSPPIKDKPECVRIEKVLREASPYRIYGRCVEMKVIG